MNPFSNPFVITLSLLLAAPTVSGAARPAAEPAADSGPGLAATIAGRASATGRNLPAGTPEYRVGTDCTYSTIQDAVDAIPSGGDGLIRVRTGGYNESVLILDKNVQVIGGHADCVTDESTDVSSINATSTGSPVISYVVQGTGEPAGFTRELILNNMLVAGGNGSDSGIIPLPGGGINVLAFPDRVANVSLDATSVFGNNSEFQGGGIAVTGGGEGQLFVNNDSRIFNNEVTGDEPQGGGLYCQGNYDVIMIGGSVHSNTAGEEEGNAARGGGIYLDGCLMIWTSGTPFRAGDEAALRNNTVHGFGGGLYADGGAQVELSGSIPFTSQSSRPLRIHSNSAIAKDNVSWGDGSAMSASGAGTQVVFDRTWTYANEADEWGTFYGTGGAEVIVERGSDVCHTPRNCSRVFDNGAENKVVAYSNGEGTTIRFQRTVVSGNSAIFNQFTSSIFESQGGIIEIDDTLVFGNSAVWGFRSWAGTYTPTIRVRRSTIAGNDFDQEVFSIREDDASFDLFDSIVHEPGTTMAEVEGSPDIDVDCVVWHDDQLGGNRTQVADPMFVDPGAGSFYLQTGSPAINYCNFAPPAPAVDLDWNPRGLSHSGQPNVHGPYDLGAYELPLGIFSDRFEE